MPMNDPMSEPVVACVPNFSEGRDASVIAAIVAAMHLPGVRLLDCTSTRDANRSVVTIAGAPDAVSEAAVRAAGVAAERIDLTTQRGTYPRMGAMDVLPFVPVAGVHLAACAMLAREAARALWDRFRLPCYLYEAAAARPDRVSLDEVRHGQFEGLREAVLRDPGRRPDVGGPGLHPTAGAVAVGARQPLIELRLRLGDAGLAPARSLARSLRESLYGVQAKAVSSDEGTQLLVKIADHRETPIAALHERACAEAARARVRIRSGSIIGLIPESAYAPGSAWACNCWSDSPAEHPQRGSADSDPVEARILERRLTSPLPWPSA
jgi:glutamate formiminotransferase